MGPASAPPRLRSSDPGPTLRSVGVGSEPFRRLLRRHRQSAGLTQEQLAERAGLSAQAIGALERGQRQHPYPHTVRALAAALGLSRDELATLEAALTPRGHRTYLPFQPSSLVGREGQIAEAGELLLSPRGRLLTMV